LQGSYGARSCFSRTFNRTDDQAARDQARVDAINREIEKVSKEFEAVSAAGCP
jgi:hypothetical protein